MFDKFIKILRRYREKGILPFVENTYYCILACFFLLTRKLWPTWQRFLLRNTLKYAREHSHFYSILLKNQRITSSTVAELLSTLPLSNKELINREHNNIYSDQIGNTWDNWSNTGGSTGAPFCFPSKHTKLQLEGIHQMMLYLKMGWKPWDTIISIDGSTIEPDKRKQHIYYKGRDSVAYGKYHFSTLYMNEETLKYYIRDLNKFAPKIMRGYPSGILDICKYIKEHKISIHFQLRSLYLTSEFFSKEEAGFIESILHCPVYGQYGHTEMGVFAYQEPHSVAYKCYPLYGYTEVLKDGKQVEIGETGEICVTSFSQRGVPLIRYQTGDLAVYGGKLKDGTVILSSLKGRTKDYIVDNNNNKIYLVGLVFGGHNTIFNHISKWQIIQDKPGIIKILIIKGIDFNSLHEDSIKKLFSQNGILCSIEYVADIPKTKSGKQKFVIQNIKENKQ